eukprot:905543-Rhodomonas_salina.1
MNNFSSSRQGRQGTFCWVCVEAARKECRCIIHEYHWQSSRPAQSSSLVPDTHNPQTLEDRDHRSSTCFLSEGFSAVTTTDTRRGGVLEGSWPKRLLTRRRRQGGRRNNQGTMRVDDCGLKLGGAWGKFGEPGDEGASRRRISRDN